MTEARQLFGTDGIRGVANQWPLTPAFVARIGQAIGSFLMSNGNAPYPTVVIGRDTRLSGEMLEHALAAGLMSRGVNTVHLGVITTPGIAYLTTKLDAQLGIVLSASHNPYADNGIKVFGSDGFKLADETELKIEKIALNGHDPASGNSMLAEKSTTLMGTRRDVLGKAQDYVAHLVKLVEQPRFLAGKRVVLECVNGAAYALAPQVFELLGAEVIAMNNAPDGVNINESYEYITPHTLSAAVRRAGACFGVSFDGDGDRAMLVDERGGFVDGDHMLAILARDMQRRGVLNHDTVVTTVMANVGLEIALREMGINMERTQVGDRYIVKRMQEGGFILGGEQSGHIIIFGEGHTTGDGIYTAIKVAEAVQRLGAPLSELAKCVQKFPQTILNVSVSHKPPLAQFSRIIERVAQTEELLGAAGRVVLRYSGTQQLARVMIEGQEQDVIEREAESIAAVIREEIGK